ncbi:MAG: tetratricopeptide repeat protein, partial [Haloplanus sp.]
PDDAIIHTRYANLLKEIERTDEAERHYERAIDSRPDCATAHHNYGLLLQGEQRLTKARTHLERAADLRLAAENDLGAVHSISRLVDICERSGDIESAIAWCDEGITLARNRDQRETSSSERSIFNMGSALKVTYSRLTGENWEENQSEDD